MYPLLVKIHIVRYNNNIAHSPRQGNSYRNPLDANPGGSECLTEAEVYLVAVFVLLPVKLESGIEAGKPDRGVHA